MDRTKNIYEQFTYIGRTNTKEIYVDKQTNEAVSIPKGWGRHTKPNGAPASKSVGIAVYVASLPVIFWVILVYTQTKAAFQETPGVYELPSGSYMLVLLGLSIVSTIYLVAVTYAGADDYFDKARPVTKAEFEHAFSNRRLARPLFGLSQGNQQASINGRGSSIASWKIILPILSWATYTIITFAFLGYSVALAGDKSDIPVNLFIVVFPLVLGILNQRMWKSMFAQNNYSWLKLVKSYQYGVTKIKFKD